MHPNEMIERYIYAVTKQLPHKTRADVAAELRSIISDMLDARCGDVAPELRDVRVVLTELGTPTELAAKYSPNANQCLIGAPYYAQYILVLKLIGAAVAFGMTVACIMLYLIEPPTAAWWGSVGQWVGMMVQGLVYSFCAVTILFAILYRKGVAFGDTSLDNLPPVPKQDVGITRTQCITDIVLSVAFMLVFLFFHNIIAMYNLATGEVTPVFDIYAIRQNWYYIAAFGIIGIAYTMFKYYEKRYTLRLLVVTVVRAVVSAALAFAWLMRGGLINPAFIEAFGKLEVGEGMFMTAFAERMPVIFLGAILLALVVDVVNTVVRTVNQQ